LYTGTRDFIWAIDPVNDDLGKLFIHVRDFGEKLFEEKGISFRAYNDIRRNVRLAYGYSREANLIFKEVMTNSFKHSQARNVKLEFKEEGEEFAIIFEDDGIGFDAEQLKTSNGLRNMRERADRINSKLKLTSNESGTKVSLYSTLKQKNRYDVTI
jgi:signal transduction histidine kinase